jgi:hypothetical protein
MRRVKCTCAKAQHFLFSIGSARDFLGLRAANNFSTRVNGSVKKFFCDEELVANSTPSGGSCAAPKNVRQGFPTTRRHPFDRSASKRKIGDSED